MILDNKKNYYNVFYMKIFFNFCLILLFVLTSCGLDDRSQGNNIVSPGGDPIGQLKVAHWVKGKSVDISKGVNVVEFWATWCPPCRTSIPHLTEIQIKYKEHGVNIIGVTNEPLETVEPFVNRMGKKMEYGVAVDKGLSTSNEFMGRYDLRGIPHAFVIKDGKIVWHGHPMKGLEDAIENALN